MGLILLAQSELPKKFWVDAFLTSIFIINRLPTKVLNFSSPFECLLHLPPDFSYFHSFGCQCFPCVRPYMPNKLSYCSTPCIFIGYCSNQKGFHCYDRSFRRVYISINVIFDETVFLARVQSPLMDSGSNVPSTVSPPHTIPIIPTDHDFSIPPDTPPDINSPISSSLSNILEPSSSTPTSSTPSYHVVTRSQTGHLRPCTYPDFHLYYSTCHPLPTLHASVIISEPCLMLKLLLYLSDI
ncbi:Retrovirus-related Pol polyprotein from transposon RE2 [Vitis vinifera]|uniref:Retrovirus-related Pol polyprotein from transposon RE2 n=1 Tax=Vitis vinifera TaxID=29760 RepID=A0A438HEE9_VITVI|nr:Retrovirus-related Pol polyprotein from transposon RE2 [Vitis vinifera]